MHNDVHNLYSSPNTLRIVSTVRFAAHVARVRKASTYTRTHRHTQNDGPKA